MIPKTKASRYPPMAVGTIVLMLTKLCKPITSFVVTGRSKPDWLTLTLAVTPDSWQEKALTPWPEEQEHLRITRLEECGENGELAMAELFLNLRYHAVE